LFFSLRKGKVLAIITTNNSSQRHKYSTCRESFYTFSGK